MIIDPSNLEVQEGYKLLIESVVPRPIAWTSTVSREGTYNLAPFSFFTVASRKVSSRKPSCLVEVFSETGLPLIRVLQAAESQRGLVAATIDSAKRG